MVEWSLLTPDIRGLNPNNGKVLSTNCKLNRKDKNKEKEKEAGNCPSLYLAQLLSYLLKSSFSLISLSLICFSLNCSVLFDFFCTFLDPRITYCIAFSAQFTQMVWVGSKRFGIGKARSRYVLLNELETRPRKKNQSISCPNSLTFKLGTSILKLWAEWLYEVSLNFETE